MSSNRKLDRLFGDIGELLAEHEDGADLDAFTEYRDDPIGFIRDVLGGEPWSRQEEIAEAVRDEPQVAVRSCNGSGKDWLAARLALWWVYARGGLVVLTGPTRQQVEETLMRRELATAFRGARDLPGTLGVKALRPTGEGKAGVLAKTASEVSTLTGLHESEVLVCISEAQAEGLETAFDAAFANAVGEHDRIFAYGNPLRPDGRFFRAFRPRSDWATLRVAASHVPNVRQGETVIPGLITRQGVDRIAREYGEDSGYYQARILAEFPTESDEGLFRRGWLDRAAKKAKRDTLLSEAYDNRARTLLAVDVARHGKDATVVARRRGDVLERFESWRGADTEETAKRVRAMAWEMGAVSAFDRDTPAVRRIVVDAVGVGGGVYDKLNSYGDPWTVSEYKGSRQAKSEDRFRNRRAESFWKLRKKLEAGEIALPDDEELFEELLAIRWRPDAQGRVMLEAKRDLAKRLGRSSDRADAAAMAWGRGTRERVTEILQWG